MPDLPPTTPPAAPLLADRYRLGARIGAGGMADVFQATDERLHREVAVKVLRRGANTAGESEAVARARFTAEGLLIARLNHPGIVSIFDAGDDGDQAFLVMERMPGTTLRDRLGGEPFAEAEVRAVVVDVLGALDAAHRAGIVHRDVKPPNVLATADGRWKVADFGIAQDVVADPEQHDLTSTGLLVGTPRYVAPERHDGHRATPASDLYSVGVILEELLARLSGPAPADLVAVAARARAVDPSARFASAAAMAAAVVDAPTLGIPTSVLPAVGAGPGPDATEVLATGAPHAPVAAAEAPTAVVAASTDLAVEPGPRPSKRTPRLAAAAIAVLAVLVAAAAAFGMRAGDDPSTPVDAVSTTTTTAPSATTTSSATTLVTQTSTATTTTVPATTTTAPKGKDEPKPEKPKPEKPKPGKGK